VPYDQTLQKVFLANHGSPNTIDPRPWVEEAKRSKAYGFKAMKFDLNRFRGERWNRTLSSQDMKAWVKILEAIRAELGPGFPLGVDFHWAFNTPEAMRFVQMVEPNKPCLGLELNEEVCRKHLGSGSGYFDSFQ